MALCNKCGTNVEEGVKFCTECGADMTAPAPVVEEQAVPVQEAPAAEQAAPVQNVEQKTDFSEKGSETEMQLAMFGQRNKKDKYV